MHDGWVIFIDFEMVTADDALEDEAFRTHLDDSAR